MLQEVTAEWIVDLPYGPVWISDKLRNDMQIAHRTKEIHDIPIFPVDVDLFKVSLGEPQRILEIVLIWSI